MNYSWKMVSKDEFHEDFILSFDLRNFSGCVTNLRAKLSKGRGLRRLFPYEYHDPG
jgi:hypothetical protein